ncbi:MAG: lytic transglycosylase domain-containing protein [Odoribacteraceae bacterium]|nr:lytic transglycosylase domain-containing protein [Odoribacteraceae bacterium]
MKDKRKYINICLLALVGLLVVMQVRAIMRAGDEGDGKEPSRVAPLSGDVYIPDRLALAGEEVPLWRRDVSESLRRELVANAYFHSHAILLLKNAPRYFARFEPILREEGVPDDFKYLAAAESSLNPRAVSPAAAVGLWQFLKSTAREHGLEVNEQVDERYHLEKATRAACRYLKEAKERFGSWTMAAAAYNTGVKNVARQVEIQQETNYHDLLLAEETSRYVFRLLALKQIIEHPARYGFRPPEPYPAEEYEEIEITSSITNLADFARENGISYKTLKRFNPWLRAWSLDVSREKTYRVAIPKNKNAYR